MLLYHITSPELWERAAEIGKYRHPSLKTEGFIHCSTEAQLPETLKRHFADAKEVLILAIVERRVRGKLKWETATNEELYPHIYGTMPIECVEFMDMWLKNAQGEWEKC